MPTQSLLELRSLLHQRFPEAVRGVHDAPRGKKPALEADWLPGQVVEVVCSPEGSGSGLLLHALLKKALAETRLMTALVDGADGLDPASSEGLCHEKFLWARCHQAVEAIRATDLLLRDGNTAHVLLDLRLLPQRSLLGLPSSLWHRLRMLAGRGGAAVAVFTPFKLVACAARRWTLKQNFDLATLDEEPALLLPRLYAAGTGAEEAPCLVG